MDPDLFIDGDAWRLRLSEVESEVTLPRASPGPFRPTRSSRLSFSPCMTFRYSSLNPGFTSPVTNLSQIGCCTSARWARVVTHTVTQSRAAHRIDRLRTAGDRRQARGFRPGSDSWRHPGPVRRRGALRWFGSGRVNAAAVRRARELAVENSGITNLPLPSRVSGELERTGATRLFKITVGDRLSVSVRGPEGEDFDLYVRRDAPPTTEQYDVVGFTSSANEDVVITPVEAGEYYVMVRSYRGSGEFDLSVSLD
jgi:hypothetical protein